MPTLSSFARRAARTLRFIRHGRKDVFGHIFRARYWGDTESVSGPGSSLSQTGNIRESLPAIIKKHQFKTLLDAPCGDLHWMRLILDDLGAKYIGGDVVPEVVDLARANNTNQEAEFLVIDIVNDMLPPVDVWMCRDVLFHFSFSTIRGVIKNFSKTEIPFVLVTSHIGDHVKNSPIITGDYREMNLFRAPFKLTQDQVVDRFDDYISPNPAREMLLLSHETFCKLL